MAIVRHKSQLCHRLLQPRGAARRRTSECGGRLLCRGPIDGTAWVRFFVLTHIFAVLLPRRAAPPAAEALQSAMPRFRAASWPSRSGTNAVRDLQGGPCGHRLAAAPLALPEPTAAPPGCSASWPSSQRHPCVDPFLEGLPISGGTASSLPPAPLSRSPSVQSGVARSSTWSAQCILCAVRSSARSRAAQRPQRRRESSLCRGPIECVSADSVPPGRGRLVTASSTAAPCSCCPAPSASCRG